jgi:SHS family lactate transporter-like MFS transporter
MGLLREIQSLNKTQRSTFSACFLGWTLDAFDFFLLTVCLKAIAADFHVGIKQVAEAIFWTLVMRPVGAFLFGAMAERFGRQPTLMVNVVAFSVFELGSAFAPGMHSFLIWRALFGIAMGGEWGVASALAFEVLPKEARGFFSGLLQEGYVVGNLLAAALYGLLFPHLHGTGMFTPWRVMFMIGSLPALLAFYLRLYVKESPAWLEARKLRRSGAAKAEGLSLAAILKYLPAFLFIVVLMTAFTSFSHGTQDLYPTFLENDHELSPSRVGLVLVIANFGALFGGICFGTLSEKFGRRKAILWAALLAIPMVPLWAWTHSVALLTVGGFLLQFMVQGAWGVIPAHLNELSPGPVRAVFPGLAYQLGNLLSSRNSVFQAAYANAFSGGMLKVALSGTVVIVALVVAAITVLGPEAKGSDLSTTG